MAEGSGDEADPEEEVLGGHVGQDDQEDLWGQEVDGGRLLKGKKEIESSNFTNLFKKKLNCHLR